MVIHDASDWVLGDGMFKQLAIQSVGFLQRSSLGGRMTTPVRSRRKVAIVQATGSKP